MFGLVDYINVHLFLVLAFVLKKQIPLGLDLSLFQLFADVNVFLFFFIFYFFYCIAELAIKPCRSSRSKMRGEFGIPKHLQNRFADVNVCHFQLRFHSLIEFVSEASTTFV